MKLLIILIVIGLLVAVGIVINSYSILNDNKNLYQGPVPLGYDLEHFRETGETILEVDN